MRDGGVGIAGGDELVARACREDDRQAWEELLRAHSDVVVIVCRSMMGRGAQTEFEEAVGQAFLAVARSRHQFRGTTVGELRAWLRTIARHEVYHVWRRRRREEERRRSWDAHESVVHSPEPAGGDPALVLCLNLLPVRQREALLLYALEDLSVEEIVARMTSDDSGPSRSAVKVWLHRARRKMAECLARNSEDGHGR